MALSENVRKYQPPTQRFAWQAGAAQGASTSIGALWPIDAH
jgi:hypothetical protein